MLTLNVNCQVSFSYLSVKNYFVIIYYKSNNIFIMEKLENKDEQKEHNGFFSFYFHRDVTDTQHCVSFRCTAS